MEDAYSLYFSQEARSWPKTLSRMTSENPSMAFSGVRSSWLMVARNCDFKRLADSAAILASPSSRSRALMVVTSKKVTTKPPSERLPAASKYQLPPIAISRVFPLEAALRRASGEISPDVSVSRKVEKESPNGRRARGALPHDRHT